MNISFDLIETMTRLLGWGIPLPLVLLQYIKNKLRPKIWKIIIITYIGFFTLNIQIEMFNEFIKIPILPLGVWVLFNFSK